VLIDYGATDSFIPPSSLIRCGLATHDQNNFRMVEMVSDVKQSVGPLVKNCIVKIGGCVTKMNLYSMGLGTYDLIIGMDWLESHRALVDCYKKKVLCQNDLGEPIVIEGIKREVTLRLISSQKVKKCMRKGCKIYVVEMISEDENPSDKLHPILSEFADVFPPKLPGLPPSMRI
jgi:hypothetical protein